MKRALAMLLAASMIFALCACGSGKQDVGGSVSSAEPELQTGTVNGGVYENDFIGIGISLDDSWDIYDEEQLAELIGLTAEQYDDEKYVEQLKNADMFYDFFASAEQGLVTVNIIIQNLGLIYGTVLDEDKIVDMSLEQMDEQLQSSSEYQGMAYYTQQAFIKQGKYMAIVTVSSFIEDITADIMSEFYGIE